MNDKPSLDLDLWTRQHSLEPWAAQEIKSLLVSFCSNENNRDLQVAIEDDSDCRVEVFWAAVAMKRFDVAELCLQAGLKIDDDLDLAFGAIYAAMALGDRDDIVAWLIAHGADIEHRCHNGWTPLLAAIAFNLERTPKCLIECGADCEARDFEDGDNTALMIAAGKGRFDLVDLLLRHGADSRKVNAHGSNAEQIAFKHGFGEIARHISSFTP